MQPYFERTVYDVAFYQELDAVDRSAFVAETTNGVFGGSAKHGLATETRCWPIQQGDRIAGRRA